MKKNEVRLSKEFKTQATKAIFAIGIFIVTYLIILVFAVVLTGVCIAGGIAIVAIKPMFATIVVGVGFASMGFLILIFLLKFIFKSHKIDRSHLVEVHAYQEPKLFSMIEEIVTEVGTNFPKKIYLSPDVNASVFYDSSFWSMFFPVKKNLQIGLGLVNTVTQEELRAILAHEFGHFSQTTMKVGSYVYNVNQVIFNMLYENESYERLIEKWGNVNGFFSMFVSIAAYVNSGIQWVLRNLYEVVNKSYMGLSREMEFHADEIAASVTGYEPLKKALLRMALADYCFNDTLNFYNSIITQNIKSESVFKDQSAVLHFLADVNRLPVINNLPEVSLEEQSKYDKSKLVIKDQWASHPTIEERIGRLEQTGHLSENKLDTLANNVFVDIVELQRQLTGKMYEQVSYVGEPIILSTDKFIEEYKESVLSNSFATIYNGYYDSKNPVKTDLSKTDSVEDSVSFNDLYSDEKVDMVYTAIALQRDTETLKNIANRSLPVKTFDYDGVRYKRQNAEELVEKLTTELKDINKRIEKNDADIYNYFRRLEEQQKKPKELERLYGEFFEVDSTLDAKFDIYFKLQSELQFVNVTTPFDEIRANFTRIAPIEEMLKLEISKLLSDSIFTTEITDEIKENLVLYTSKTWNYFRMQAYNEDNLNVLYTVMNNYVSLLSRKCFLHKRALLTYQEHLMYSHHT